MQPTHIVCGNCQARLKLPAALPAGKKLKCPKCGGVITVPAAETKPVAEPKPAAESQPAARAQPLAPKRPVTAPAAVVPLAPAQKRCPYCGESILADAVKCRHCGEFLDPDRARPSRKADELTPAEYFVATIFCPVGLVIGVVWTIQKLNKARKMLLASGLSTLTATALALLVFFYLVPWLGKSPLPPPSPVGMGNPGTVFTMPNPSEMMAEPELPKVTPPVATDLEKQPPEIQRAMRATVCIAQRRMIGSGVVIQREGDTALILTNRHVVDEAFAQTQGALQVPMSRIPPPKITFVTAAEQSGKVVWVAPDEIDLALVEATCPDGVEAVPWSSTAEVQISEQVFAMGNPAGLGWTYTRGVVSALRTHEYGTRKVPVVQTDTRIGPGNSGGGLYNQKGELIGINTFVVASSPYSVGESGLGFAIGKAILLELKPEILKPAP